MIFFIILILIMDHLKSKPTPYPMEVIAVPRIRVSKPDLNLFKPIMAALAKPRLNSSTTPMAMTGITCWWSLFWIAEEMM